MPVVEEKETNKNHQKRSQDNQVSEGFHDINIICRYYIVGSILKTFII
jgi:hypothetical protein